MRERQLGENNSFYGKKHSEETKEKWKESRIVLSGIDNYNFGRNHKNSSSQYSGVTKRKNRWEASMKANGKNIYIGNFSTEIEAAKARDAKVIELFGSNAKLNFSLN
jgi:hypothetical protein